MFICSEIASNLMEFIIYFTSRNKNQIKLYI